MQELEKVIKRFWGKVKKTNTCWLWTGGVAGNNSYGSLQSAIKTTGERFAHRISYKLCRGEIPTGKMVLHTCDVPTCVNPDHLWLGDQFDNMRDMMIKGRRGGPTTRLNAKKVRDIRSLYSDNITKAEIAKLFNISHTNVSSVLNGSTWKHVK